MDIAEIAQDVLAYSETVAIIENIWKSLGIPKIAEHVINFRDGLFHYIKCYEADKGNNKEEFLRQEANLYEHLNRGYKDCLLYTLLALIRKIENLISHEDLSNEKKSKLRIHLHNFKNVSLEIRLDGIDVRRLVLVDSEEIVLIKKLVEDFYKDIHSDSIIKALYKKLFKQPIFNPLM